MHRYIILLCILAVSFAACTDTTEPPNEQPNTRVIVSDLDTPWEIVWGPDNWIWMTERPGRISRVNPETGEIRRVAVLPDVYEEDYEEHGLLGMTLHPNFADSPHVFVAYNYRTLDSGNWQKVVRFTYNGSALVNPVILVDSIRGYPSHDGCRLVISPDRKLYICTGDAMHWPSPQGDDYLNGKVLRINLDGTAPADNPMASLPWPSNIVWSKGHRNPQGLVMAPNGILYESEHGPDYDDEINIIAPDGNYGWPEVIGACDGIRDGEFDPDVDEVKYCTDSTVTEPIHAWGPTRAISGIDYYDHAKFPEWKNSLLVTALKASELRVLKLSDDGRRVLSDQIYFSFQFGRLRDICISPEGRVFFCTSNRDGRGNRDDRIVEVLGVPTAAK